MPLHCDKRLRVPTSTQRLPSKRRKRRIQIPGINLERTIFQCIHDGSWTLVYLIADVAWQTATYIRTIKLVNDKSYIFQLLVYDHFYLLFSPANPLYFSPCHFSCLTILFGTPTLSRIICLKASSFYSLFSPHESLKKKKKECLLIHPIYEYNNYGTLYALSPDAAYTGLLPVYSCSYRWFKAIVMLLLFTFLLWNSLCLFIATSLTHYSQQQKYSF